MGAFIRLLQVFRDAGVLLHVLLRSDSLCMRNAVFFGVTSTTRRTYFPQHCWSFPVRVFSPFEVRSISSNGTSKISQLGENSLWKTSLKLTQLKKLLSLKGTTSQEVEYNDACAFWCSMHSLS